MFNKEIKLKTIKDIRYGSTRVEPEDTLTEITKLLRKHGCSKVGTIYEGDDIRIGFELDGLPFLFDVPRVFVQDVYHPRIGIRIVFRYLETILELTKSRAVPVHILLLPMAQYRDPVDGTTKSLGDKWIENVSQGKNNTRLLLEGQS